MQEFKEEIFYKKREFLGHSDIAPLRKVDPGEKFPWKKLSYYKIGLWYKKNKKGSKKKKKIDHLFFKNLKKLGYRYFSVNKRKIQDRKIVESFQRHYLQKNVTGKIDQKTYEISHFLAR